MLTHSKDPAHSLSGRIRKTLVERIATGHYKSGERLVECPITFHPRVGVSKGGNVNNWRALKVGLRMILGLCFGWPTP